jgi:hypothetical protein
MSLAENAVTIRPAPSAHGSRILRLMHMGPAFCVRSFVGSPVAPMSGDSPACDLALFARPFFEGAVSRHYSAHAGTMANGRFAPEAALRSLEVQLPLYTRKQTQLRN